MLPGRLLSRGYFLGPSQLTPTFPQDGPSPFRVEDVVCAARVHGSCSVEPQALKNIVLPACGCTAFSGTRCKLGGGGAKDQDGTLGLHVYIKDIYTGPQCL